MDHGFNGQHSDKRLNLQFVNERLSKNKWPEMYLCYLRLNLLIAMTDLRLDLDLSQIIWDLTWELFRKTWDMTWICVFHKIFL